MINSSTLAANITLNSLTTTSILPPSPVFAAQVTNFDGLIQIGVAHGNTSVTSPLLLNVQNSVAPSIISMDGIFEGCFSVQAKLSKVFVQDARENNSRTIDYETSSPDLVIGRVSNDPKPPSYQDACHSVVNIMSALKPVNLTFGP